MTKKTFFNFKFNQHFNKQKFRQNNRVVDDYFQLIYQQNHFDNNFKSNQIYQSNRQNTNDRQLIRVLSFAKQLLFLINENEFDSRTNRKFNEANLQQIVTIL